MAVTQVQVLYKGQVQGVGFRFTAQRIARKLGVAGWVKNLANGDVEVVIEAEQTLLDTFLKEIRSYFSRYIVEEQMNVAQPAGRLSDFEIRF